MLDRAADSASAWATEAAVDAGHVTDGDSQPTTTRVAQCRNRGAEVDLLHAPCDRRHVTRVDRDGGDVAVDVEAGDLSGGGATVGECDRCLTTVDVVGVGENRALCNHDSRSDVAVTTYPDYRGPYGGGEAADRLVYSCQHFFLHCHLQVASIPYKRILCRHWELPCC